MTKVCHITSAHDGEDIRIFHKECVSLAKAGYDVYLVQVGESYEKNGVHLVGLGAPAKGRLDRFLHAGKNAYRKALEVDADIYHLHDPELLGFGLKLKRRGKKVIFDSHEFYAEQIKHKHYIPAFCRGFVAKIYDRYQKYILRRLDGVVFPCLLDGRDPFEGYCRHTAIVNNVPMLHELYDHYDPTVQKYPRSVCQIGSLTHNRGITHLVQAAAKADCTLYLGGEFESAEYEAQLRAMPAFDHVVYLGLLDRQQVLETLQRCQLGAATLLNIGQYNSSWNLSTKAYEQMALALPVILNQYPYNDMMVEKYQFGVCVDPEDPDEIAAVIRRLLDDPDEVKRMGENGRRAIREEFNWGVEEQKLLALYQEIVND